METTTKNRIQSAINTLKEAEKNIDNKLYFTAKKQIQSVRIGLDAHLTSFRINEEKKTAAIEISSLHGNIYGGDTEAHEYNNGTLDDIYGVTLKRKDGLF